MNELSDDTIKQVLREVPVPGQKGDIISLKLLSGLVVRDGIVHISIETTPDQIEMMEGVRKNCEKAIRGVPGVQNVTAVLTEERKDAETQTANQTRDQKLGAEGVDKIIAIASGKGGVGKSTTAVNVAMALARLGNKVGIMDADIYGPSIPQMLGIPITPPKGGADNKFYPHEQYGLKVVSAAFLQKEGQPLMLRGPMLGGIIQQFLQNVEWGELDYLVIDLPPGTGDVQLTLTQRAPLSGAVVVTTPQEVSLIDAAKGVRMFETVKVPLLGIVENMSHFICDGCDKKHYIFKSGGGNALAEKFKIPFLTEIPLMGGVVDGGDKGVPVIMSDPTSPATKAYKELAGQVAAQLSIIHANKDKPASSFELAWEG